MKLNQDCVRSVLLEIESLAYGNQLKLEDLHRMLPDYSMEDLQYTCIKLDEAGYIKIITAPTLNSSIPLIISINDLTFYGHEFLEHIRSDENWKEAKKIASKLGDFALSALSAISEGITNAAINSYFQKNS